MLPGLAPTTTKSVFLDTLPEALPPRVRIASLAPSRLKCSSEPVTTTVSPASVFGLVSSWSSAIRTPAAAQRSTIATCQSTVNHSRTASAITGPTPSTPLSSSAEAARMASSEPRARASERAAVGPTWRIDNATRTRHNGWRLARSRLSSRRCPFADSSPSSLV